MQVCTLGRRQIIIRSMLRQTTSSPLVTGSPGAAVCSRRGEPELIGSPARARPQGVPTSPFYTQTLRRSGHRIGMSVAFATPWGTTALCAHRTARAAGTDRGGGRRGYPIAQSKRRPRAARAGLVVGSRSAERSETMRVRDQVTTVTRLEASSLRAIPAGGHKCAVGVVS